MKIEIWSDYACPYCYIGKRFLEQALSEFEHADKVKIEYKVFELYPNAGKEVTNTTQSRIEQKYGKTPVEAQQMIDQIIALGTRAGIAMNYYTVQNTNTFDAHRLTKFAGAKNKGTAMIERLFKAYFTDNIPLANHRQLLDIATEIGFNREEVEVVLAGNEFATEATDDELQARKIGIHSVPYFLIDGQGTSVGTKPKNQWLATLNYLWQENQKQNFNSAEGSSCGIDGCE